MSTKDIKTSPTHASCDVCGRTLLRGERAQVYVNGGARRSVCELCKARAVHEGWVREGTVPEYKHSETRPERRRSLLGRLRQRRETAAASGPPSLDDELSGNGWSPPPATPPPPTAPQRETPRPPERRIRLREPRHVRAVPTSDEQKIAAAVDVFNQSEHRRTVAGVARSLGAPSVSLRPDPERTSLVNVVVAWELCWYRYVVDLSDDLPAVRVEGQGYELAELSEPERLGGASADDTGALVLRT